MFEDKEDFEDWLFKILRVLVTCTCLALAIAPAIYIVINSVKYALQDEYASSKEQK